MLTWFDHIEQKKSLLVPGIVLICVAILSVTALRDPYSYDVYWHIQTAIDWMEKGLSPWSDHFSFTYHEHKISGQAIIFQLMIAKLVQAYELEPGLQIFKFSSFVLALTLFTIFLRKLKSPALIYLLALPLLVVLIQLRSITRPELLSYSFSILAVMLWYRARDRISRSGVIPMALLMFVWSNYHTSVIGYVIFFGYFVDTAIAQLRNKAPLNQWVRWFLWGLLVLIVGFLNPSLEHSVISALSFAPEWKELIQEYQNSSLYVNVPPVYLTGLAAITTTYLALKRRTLGVAIITIILAYNAAMTSRLVTPAGIVILCLFVWMVANEGLERKIATQPHWCRLTYAIVFSISFMMTMIYGVNFARAAMEENKTSALRLPGSIVRHLKNANLEGNILNSYEIGGYLAYELSPDSLVYIDGRTNILYPVEHYMRYLEAKNSPAALKKELDTHEINFAILDNERRSFVTTYDSGELFLDFADANFSLFIRDKPAFPLTGKLLARPACFTENMLEQLELEQSKSLFDLPGSSILIPYLIHVSQFAKSENQAAYLTSLSQIELPNEHIYRFLAYQALLQEEFESAKTFLRHVNNWDLGEYLVAATASIKSGQQAEAEILLDQATRVGWSGSSDGENIFLLRLLKTIQAKQEMGFFEDDYIEQLEKNILDIGFDPENTHLDPNLFCSANNPLSG